MRMHLEAIDVDLWYVVKNGVPKTGEGVTPADVKKFVQLDSTIKNIICGHLTKGQYGRVSALETSKLVWDWLSKVNEGVSNQRDQRISVLRNLFNRFKRNDNENVQLTFDRLTDITNELHALGATEITKHEIVKTLLRSLDSSFDTLALMIQEHPDFKTLDPSDILERLNTHEFQLFEKRDIYGPNYGRTRALKAKDVSSSEEESDCSSGDPEDIGKELAMLVKKFQKFTKKKGFRKSSRSSSRNDEASTHDHKKRACHKCKKPGHYISECKARAFVGKEMDSEVESASEEAEVESEEESDSGVASLALATAYVAKSIFNTEDNGSITNADANNKDDSAPTYCFMARGAKKAMEHIQKLLDKSDDLLDAEMTRSQSLIEDIKNLHVKYEELESRHETLSTTHEKLSYDYLQRKQELEKLRAVHEDLQKENESLRAQQISPAQEGFEPPCLKCLERDNATSVAECSTAATIAISSTANVVTNPSAEDTTTIADENARYIGANCKNGPPMKKIWVPKRCLENLPVNVIMTPQGKKTNPRPKASYGPKASYRQRTHKSHPNTNVL
ncbi:unnamed protein product [Triticum aestivum]|uniref:CCHC-type domain-containing protein n=1 Tax=Triticum aestivum TaxID=4565 RepID=A0A7H4LFP4_WHEAT|nr:unnamed protein product [Triticum aestivum]